MIQLVDHLYRIDRIPLISWGSQLFGHASMRDTRFEEDIALKLKTKFFIKWTGMHL